MAGFFGAFLAGAPGGFQEAQDKAMKHALEMQRLRMQQQKIGQEQMGDAVYGRWLQSFGQQGAGPSPIITPSPAGGQNTSAMPGHRKQTDDDDALC